MSTYTAFTLGRAYYCLSLAEPSDHWGDAESNLLAVIADYKAGRLDITGQMSVVAIRAGASGDTNFRDGVAIFVHPKSGAMLDLSMAGQQVKIKM